MTGASSGRRHVRTDVGFCLSVYLMSRLLTAAGVGTAAVLDRGVSWGRITTANDAWWYEFIARHGYGSTLRLHLPHDHFHDRYSPWAFYPGYPALIRVVHEVTRLSYANAALVASLLVGAVAVAAVYALAAQAGGADDARRATLLFAVWPGSAALSLPYSEGLFIAAVAIALRALLREQWLVAGVAGLVATATRAMGWALVAAALVVAVTQLRSRRTWRPLVEPGISALGAIGFYAYGWARTGDALLWRHAENLWKQRFDLGASSYWHFAHDLLHRDRHGATTWLLALGLLLMATAALSAWRAAGGATRPALVVYAAIAAVMILGYGHVGPRPRMVLAVVPVFVWMAQALPQRVLAFVIPLFAGLLGLASALFVTVVVP